MPTVARDSVGVWLLVGVASFGCLFGSLAAAIARRKGRSPVRWFAAGFLFPLPGVLMATFASPGGEPWRMRAPLVLVVIVGVVALPLALLAIAAQILG